MCMLDEDDGPSIRTHFRHNCLAEVSGGIQAIVDFITGYLSEEDTTTWAPGTFQWTPN